jgi:hypothetical protein
MAFAGATGTTKDRPRDASHQILIGQLGNRDWYLLSGAPIAVAGSLRRLPTRPKQLGASKARQPASPRPRTRSSNPVPSSEESSANSVFDGNGFSERSV